MAITLAPGEAFSALVKRVTSDDPVVGTFRNAPNNGKLATPSVIMQVEVDGTPQAFEFCLKPDGTWAAHLNQDL